MTDILLDHILWEEIGGLRDVRCMSFSIEDTDDQSDVIDYLCREGRIKDFCTGTVFLVRLYRTLNIALPLKHVECYLVVANQKKYNSVLIGDAMM